MKGLLKTSVTLVAVFAISGCSTIVFTNDQTASSEVYDLWHHNVAYSLYELSDPVTLSRYCEHDWAEVIVEKDVITAVAGNIDNFTGVDIWDPWAVSVTCAK